MKFILMNLKGPEKKKYIYIYIYIVDPWRIAM